MKRLSLLAISLLSLAACKGEDVSANVNCKVNAGPTIDCSIQQTKGKSAVKVCWDFKISCESGATLEALGNCETVKDGETKDITIPTDKVKVEGTCEGEKSAEVTNMKLTAA